MNSFLRLLFQKQLFRDKLSITRLRLWFFTFFLVLTIPSMILSYSAYEKLQWKNFYQYQKVAQSLAVEINDALNQAVLKEESRSDAEYSFIVLEGEPRANFLQRSVLSRYPVESDLPGVIGYFQVDSNGRFSSPLLPLIDKQAVLYGISNEDKLLRKQLIFNLHHILSENQLLAAGNKIKSDKAKPDQVKPDQVKKATRSGITAKSSVESNLSGSVLSDEFSLDSQDEVDDESGKKERVATEEKTGSGFSKLQSIAQQKKISQGLSMQQGYDESQVSGYNPYQKSDKKNSNKLISETRSKRKEQNYYPESEKILSSAPQEMVMEETLVEETRMEQISIESANRSLQNQQVAKLNINLFESELEPFRFSLLKSGHFVAYRQVWRDNSRLIQGAILSMDMFFSQAVKTRFERSSLASFTRLDITYEGNLLTSYSQPQITQNNNTISGASELLSSTSLADPFGQLSLVFHIVNIPSDESGQFIFLIASLLLLALVFGTYSLYRLSSKQSYLAQQHQDFISSVSHELKTPITSIKMYGEILKQGWATQSKKEEYYDFIHSESERLSRLISNILQISKINRNCLKLSLKPVAVREIKEMIYTKIKSQITQNGFHLDLLADTSLDENSIAIDIDALIQIMINIVDNAIKYASQCEQKKIEIDIRKIKNKLQISVRDYGPGIDKDKTSKIFELFYRIGNELTRESKGTGIGLSLVKEMTLQMNGEVKVVNRKIGAEFLIIFPLA